VVESGALLKRCTSKGYRGFESLPHRWQSDSVKSWNLISMPRVLNLLPERQSRMLSTNSVSRPESSADGCSMSVATTSFRSRPNCLIFKLHRRLNCSSANAKSSTTFNAFSTESTNSVLRHVATPANRNNEFEYQYRSRVVQRLDVNRLFGVRLVGAEALSQELTNTYVPQAFVNEGSAESRPLELAMGDS
jgi:hypothetical protein